MYANKENAWQGYTDDRYYGAKRFREYWRRMLVDRGMRYYIAATLIVLLVASTKLYSMQQEQRAAHGLIGPKKKKYRSRLTVVLDVDETLVSYGDKAFRMQAGLVARPHLAELLDYLTDIDAEVVLWAACSERYMKQVLSVIDPTGVRVSQYVTRDKEWFTNDNYYEKNIAWLKRSYDDTLIVENRALSVRNCNANAILVDDFIRGEYMDTGQDFPPNDHALLTVRHIIADLERSGQPVPEYLADRATRDPDLHEVPCHNVIRQLPEELARGVFYFVGDKYASVGTMKKSLWMKLIDPMTNKTAISKDAKTL
ncbi:nuclear lim interactor-interacting factor [Strigomonas culicis]|nr:nuclear lim interactor-interacting factor [Strigomonas culicis]|eukprot:EPY37025.1 nuclear lim interactor-interacting factor [Strigomonas culicis]